MCFLSIWNKVIQFHCVKSVCIPSFSGPYFLALGLNTERYPVFSPNARKCGPEKPKYGYLSRTVQFSSIQTNSNMENLMLMFILSVLDWEYLFWANLAQKMKITSLCWNLVVRLIRRWSSTRGIGWCSFFRSEICNIIL